MQKTRTILRPSRKPETAALAAAVAATLLTASPALHAQALGVPGGAGGGEGDVFYAQVYAGIDRSDNIAQRSSGSLGGGTNGNLTTVGLNTNLAHDGRKLDYGLAGDLARVDYSDVYDATTQGALAGFLVFGAPDDLLQWNVRDSVTQSRVNALAGSTPDNREYVNTFGTGPTLNFRFGRNGFAKLEGVYGRQSYEDSPLDANTLMGSAALGRVIGTSGFVALQATAGKTEFAEDLYSPFDYDLREYFLSYHSGERSRSSVTAELGYTEVESDRYSTSDPLVRLEITRQMSELTSVFARAVQQYGSAATASQTGGFTQPGGGMMSSGNALRVGEFDTGLSVPGAVRTRGFDVGASLTGRRTTLSLLAGRQDERYEATASLLPVALTVPGALTPDRKVTHVQAMVDRDMSSTRTARLSADFRREDLGGALPTLDTQEYRFTLDQRLGRRLGVQLNVAYLTRDDAGSIYEFSEMRYGLRLTWLLTRPTAGLD